MSKQITMICEQCLSRNYKTNTNENSKNRLELKKYCPKCKQSTLHKETR